MNRRIALFACALLLSGGVAPIEAQKRKELPKAKDIGPKERDIQIGREAAREVEKQMYVVPNKELTDYVNRVGKRLVATGLLDQDFPYTFKVVQEPSLNAFALPGGPMFVHTGLIAAAENEAQLAGVLAHELSHVALRHGLANSAKQQTAAGIGAVAGAVLGGILGGGLGQIAQVGGAMAGQGFAMKFSRGAESEADLLGSYAMAKAGYNPIELGRFFERLEKEMGGDPGMVQQMFSSHPNPGNRTKSIEEQVPFMPAGPYNAQEGDLNRMRAVVQRLPAAPKGRTAQGGQGGGAPVPAGVPQGSPVPSFQISGNPKTVNAGLLSISHPDNWQAYQARDSYQITIAPQNGLVEGGGLGAGVIVSLYQPKRARTLPDATRELLEQMRQQNQGQMETVGQAERIQVSGYEGILTKLQSPSPYANDRENDYVVTVAVENRMLYMVFVGPSSRWGQLEPVYQKMLQSVRIGN